MSSKDKAIAAIRNVLSLTPHEHEPVALWVRAKGTAQIYLVTAVRDGRVYTYEVEVYAGRTTTITLVCTGPMFNA